MHSLLFHMSRVPNVSQPPSSVRPSPPPPPPLLYHSSMSCPPLLFAPWITPLTHTSSSPRSCRVRLPGREPDGGDVTGLSWGMAVSYWTSMCMYVCVCVCPPLAAPPTYSWKSGNSHWWPASSSNPVSCMHVWKTGQLRYLTFSPAGQHNPSLRPPFPKQACHTVPSVSAQPWWRPAAMFSVQSRVQKRWILSCNILANTQLKTSTLN